MPTGAASTAIDLSRLPAPAAVEPLDFEAILAGMKADLVARDPAFDRLGPADPAIKLLEIAAYRELLLRQRVNEAVRSVLVAYAAGSDLDHLAALFGVARAQIAPADPTSAAAAVLESDEELRRRILLAPDSWSVAGPASAYVYHALTAHPGVLDASATSPAPGEVVVALLARDGAATQEMVAAVEAVLAGGEVRPLTDHVTVRAAELVPFAVRAQLLVRSGPDATLVLDQARANLDQLILESRRVGRDLARSAIFAALHIAGIHSVALAAPVGDVLVGDVQAAHCTAIDLSIGGTAE